ncbi:MAG: peptidase S1 [Caulobacteraceae bacterium]|nr:peptidase S1 [Caulobacteraceae bacterium]
MRLKRVALAATGLLWSVSAFAQDWRAPPGDLLSPPTHSGFAPDPYTTIVDAGGGVDAAGEIGGACVGYIGSAPDLSMHFTTDGHLPLNFSTQGFEDTVLVIRGPSGSYHCDDNSGNGRNARFRFAQPESGYYDVWVGLKTAGTRATVEVSVSELDDREASYHQ